MTSRVSEVYGKPIYSEDGEKIGKVKDVILDMEEGKADRLTIEEMEGVSKRQLKKLLKEKTINYDNVESVGDIVLLGNNIRRSTGKEKGKEETKKEESEKGAFGSFIDR